MRGRSRGPGKKRFPVSQAGALSPMLGGVGEDAGLVCTSPGRGGMERDTDVHWRIQTQVGGKQLEMGRGMANSEQNMRDGVEAE